MRWVVGKRSSGTSSWPQFRHRGTSHRRSSSSGTQATMPRVHATLPPQFPHLGSVTPQDCPTTGPLTAEISRSCRSRLARATQRPRRSGTSWSTPSGGPNGTHLPGRRSCRVARNAHGLHRASQQGGDEEADYQEKQIQTKECEKASADANRRRLSVPATTARRP